MSILKKENRIVLIVAIICLIFIGVIINYTYSFFAVEKTNSSIIAGEAESMKLDLTVVEKSSTNNGKLIPQLDEYITSAVKGRNGSCIDDNNNTVCQVYKITLKNSGSSSVHVNGEVVLNKQNNPNLKWAILNNTDANVLTSPVLSGNIKTPEETALTSNELFTAGQTKYYFIVVWISEKGQAQIDSGKFTGVVNFNNNEGGSEVTSMDTLVRLGLDDELNETELTTFTTVSTDSDSGIYATEDDLGTSYYFRGDVTNNYVKFGKNASNQDMYWRIVRINGDGSIRMIYDGTQAHTNGTASTDRQIGESAFNTNYADNAFVGYMNGTTDGTNFPSGGTNSTSYAEAHANTTNSTIKTYIDNWYKTNIEDTGYSGYVVDAIYCNDRKITTNQDMIDLFSTMLGTTVPNTGFGGGETNITLYGIYDRFKPTAEGDMESMTPTLTCAQENDRFTKNEMVGSVAGNAKLTYPVGLLTTDEAFFAGGYGASNTTYYLYTGQWYWTASPDGFSDGGAGVFFVSSDGYAGYGYFVNNTWGVRPAISLSSTAIIGGSGTAIDPFIVE